MSHICCIDGMYISHAHCFHEGAAHAAVRVAECVSEPVREGVVSSSQNFFWLFRIVSDCFGSRRNRYPESCPNLPQSAPFPPFSVSQVDCVHRTPFTKRGSVPETRNAVKDLATAVHCWSFVNFDRSWSRRTSTLPSRIPRPPPFGFACSPCTYIVCSISFRWSLVFDSSLCSLFFFFFFPCLCISLFLLVGCRRR